MVQVLLPARLLQEAAACAVLGAALGAARAFLPVRGRAAFAPDVLLSGAVLLACQSYAAGYSAASASYSTPPSSLCISCKNRSLTQSVTSWRLRKFCFKSTRTQLPSSF